MNVGDLANMLASSNVTVQSSNDLNTPGGIEIIDGFSWASASLLTISARHNIFVKASVMVAGSGALTLNYGTLNGDSDLLFQKKGRIKFRHVSSSLVINRNPYVLANTLSGLAAAIAANTKGFFALASDYDAGPDGTYSAAPIHALGAERFTDGVLNGLGNSIQNLSVESFRKRTYSAMI